MKKFFAGILVAVLLAGAALAVPPTREKIYEILAYGVGIAEYELRTDASVTATTEPAFTTDLTAAQKSSAYTQQIVIRNTSSDNGGTGSMLCVGLVAWSGLSTCATLCTASTMTCTGATTDGKHLQGGEEWAPRLDGTSCVCLEGQAGGTASQTLRIIR